MDNVQETTHDVVLLPLNVPTVTGSIYTKEAVEDAFKEFSARVKARTVCCEYGPPNLTGRSDWRTRADEIDLQNVCATIVDTHLEENHWMGKVKLFGPKAGIAQQLIDDCVPFMMGMRALTYRNAATPHIVDRVERVITFDFVAAQRPDNPRIVCAANRYALVRKDRPDLPAEECIVAGPRHDDGVMSSTIRILEKAGYELSRREHGFVDQHGRFYDRHQALVIAKQNTQTIGSFGSENFGLCSEDLY